MDWPGCSVCVGRRILNEWIGIHPRKMMVLLVVVINILTSCNGAWGSQSVFNRLRLLRCLYDYVARHPIPRNHSPGNRNTHMHRYSVSLLSAQSVRHHRQKVHCTWRWRCIIYRGQSKSNLKIDNPFIITTNRRAETRHANVEEMPSSGSRIYYHWLWSAFEYLCISRNERFNLDQSIRRRYK